MKKKKKILGFSDYGSSGLAYNVRSPLAHWHAQGHEVWLLGCGYDGNIERVDRSAHMYPYAERIIPCNFQLPRGHAELPEAIAKIQPDVVFSGLDLWMMKSLLQPETDAAYANHAAARHVLGHATRHFTHVGLFPLENLITGGFINRSAEQLIGQVDIPVCYSHFSHQAILRSTGLDVPFIPLSIDNKVFYPRDRAQARKAMTFQHDAFVISMVATNQWPKLWGEFMEVMGRVTKRHGNIRVLPWTTYRNDHGGVDIEELVYRHDLGDFMLHPGNLVGNSTDQFMGEFYSAIDLLVLTTAAEGAGLPPMQARACGTPALVSANTANVEYAGHPFELIPSHENGLIHGFSGPQNTVVHASDIGVLEDRIEELYTNHELRKTVGEAGRRSMEAFYPEKILPLWDQLLDSIA